MNETKRMMVVTETQLVKTGVRVKLTADSDWVYLTIPAHEKVPTLGSLYHVTIEKAKSR